MQRFCKVYIETVNNFAPIKRNYTRRNLIFFMTKNFQKKSWQDREDWETIWGKIELKKIKYGIQNIETNVCLF